MDMDSLLLPLLFLCVIVHCVSTLKKCASEERCICTTLEDRTWMANCSNLNLSFFPKFHKDVSVIYINNNSIQTGKLPRNLRELYISKNKIWPNGSSNLSFIQNLTQLEILDISNNVNFKRNMRYPAVYFRLLQKLKVLYIDGLWGGDFNTKDWNLSSLTNLTISGKTGKCYFERLHQGFFTGLPRLRFLQIMGCQSLRSIDTGVFCSLHHLHTLDLSFNEHLKFAPLRNVSHDLQFVNVQVLKTKKIHCTFGIGTYLSRDDFFYFRNTSIKELDLSGNRIEQMDIDTPKYFPVHLEMLNVSNNQFVWGLYMLMYPFLRNLRIADVSRQHSHSFHRVDAYSCENDLDCTELSLTVTSHVLRDKLQHNLKNSKISRGMNITFNAPPKLQKFYFHSSRLSFSIGEMRFGKNHITEYHVQNNIMPRLEGPMYGVEFAQFVDFYGNFIRYVSPFFFDTFPNLIHLNLSNNLLGNCLSDSVQLDHFHALTKLKEIRLSSNGISTLPSKLLSNALSLQRLDLSHNLITDFIYTLDGNGALQYIDLSSNRLKYISRETIRHLENIHRRNNLSVDLSGNLLDCTCETTFFLNWIRDSKIIFVNKHDYQCRMPHNRKQTFLDLNKILKTLHHECSSNLSKIVFIPISVMAILIVSLTVTWYKYRWTIRYFFYLTKWEIQNFVNPTKQKRQRNYEYSAFIIYAEKDSNFAETEMVHQLEELNDMKLCLPSRDLSPNLRTYANITRAIHNSRKIICLITEAFVEDYWCMYQLQMAEEERIRREDCDCNVYVLFNPLSIHNFEGIQRSLLLVSIVEQRSYALFPENKAEHATFWKRLIDTVH